MILFIASNRNSKLRANHNLALQDLQLQLNLVRKTAEDDAERIRKRTEAEIADLKTYVAKLEFDLEKV